MLPMCPKSPAPMLLTSLAIVFFYVCFRLGLAMLIRRDTHPDVGSASLKIIAIIRSMYEV